MMMWLRGKRVLITLPGGGAITLPSPLFDTSIGQGVSTAGRTNLPLKSGAIAYKVGNGGNDSNDGLTHATRLATGAAAVAKMRDGVGDMCLFAEGSTFTSHLPSINNRTGGESLRYPWVFQSYRPSDENNQALWGAPATEADYPVFTGVTPGNWAQGGIGQRYHVLRGVKFDPTSISGQGIGLNAVLDGFLIENVIYPYGGMGVGCLENIIGAARFANHWIWRCNSFYHAHNTDPGAGTSGSLLYLDGCDSITAEDNKLHGAGYRSMAERNLATTAGGGVQFRHAMYQQDGSKCVFRRNLVTSPCADGGSHRGDLYHYGNAILDAPIVGGLGDGSGYNTNAHTSMGYRHDFQFNVLAGSSSYVTDSGARAWGIGAAGSMPGSEASNNILVNNPTWPGSGFTFNPKVFLYDSTPWFETAAQGIDTSIDFNNNVAFHFTDTSAGGVVLNKTYGSFNGTYTSADLSRIHSTASGNIWDGPTDGNGNVNVNTVSFSNAYGTLDQIAQAAGFADYAALYEFGKHNPTNLSAVRTLTATVRAGFNQSWPTGSPSLAMVSAVAGTNGAATITVSTTDKFGMIHVVAVPAGSAAPAEDQIRGRRAGDWNPVRDGAWARLQPMAAGNQAISLSSLQPGSYDVYAIRERHDLLSSIVVTSTPLVIPAWSIVGWADYSRFPSSSRVWAISNGGLKGTLTNPNTNDRLIRSLIPSNDGEVEITINTVGTVGIIIGFCNEAMGINNWMGQTGNFGSGWSDAGAYWGARSGGTFTTGLSYGAGDRLRLKNLNGVLSYYKNDVLRGTVDATALGSSLYFCATTSGTGWVLDITDISQWP